MKLEDQQNINASREQVFAGLNDPEILKQCIPGCDTLEKLSDTEMTATLTLKVGPVKAKFNGQVTLSNLNPPESYTISGKGKAGPAGHAKGGADVRLQEEADGSTMLIYSVNADVGGKIAQLGSRLIDSTAKKLAAQFFEKFAELVATEAPTDAVESPAEEEALSVAAEAPVEEKSNRLYWIVGLVVSVAAIWYFTR